MAEVDGFGNAAQVPLHQSDPGAYHGNVSAFGSELLDKKKPGDWDRLLFIVACFRGHKIWSAFDKRSVFSKLEHAILSLDP